LNKLKLPELGDVEIKHADIAQELFGDNAWINPDTQTMLQPEIKKFINIILASTWNRYRKAIRRDQKAIETLEAQINMHWLGKCHLVSTAKSIAEFTVFFRA
jgi:hypothetical protein